MLEAEATDRDDILRFTVGRLQVWPNSPNTVPSRVQFTIDLRHPDEAVLSRYAKCIYAHAKRTADDRRCDSKVESISQVKPVHFPSSMTALVRATTQAEGVRYLEFPFGAGHDAMYFIDSVQQGWSLYRAFGALAIMRRKALRLKT
jgi:N-carbamoyl-L-amino-acid hydrolase